MGPMMASHSFGADVTKRIAASVLGGIVSTLTIQLIVFPARFPLSYRSFSPLLIEGDPN